MSKDTDIQTTTAVIRPPNLVQIGDLLICEDEDQVMPDKIQFALLIQCSTSEQCRAAMKAGKIEFTIFEHYSQNVPDDQALQSPPRITKPQHSKLMKNELEEAETPHDSRAKDSPLQEPCSPRFVPVIMLGECSEHLMLLPGGYALIKPTQDEITVMRIYAREMDRIRPPIVAECQANAFDVATKPAPVGSDSSVMQPAGAGCPPSNCSHL